MNLLHSMKRFLLPLLAALALPAAFNSEAMKAEESRGWDDEQFCNMSYESLEKPYFKRVWRMKCGQKSDVEKANLNNISSSTNPKIHNLCKNDNDYKRCIKYFSTQLRSEEENAKRCLIGLYPCKKVNQDDIPSKLRKKVKNKLASEQQRKKEKFARDLLTRKQREDSKLSQFTHKGITYVASKSCSDGKQFYWNVEKGFLKKEKVVEIGCLSDYELQSLKNQSRGGSGGAGGGSGSNFLQQQQINRNMMNNWENTWRRQNNITDY